MQDQMARLEEAAEREHAKKIAAREQRAAAAAAAFGTPHEQQQQDRSVSPSSPYMGPQGGAEPREPSPGYVLNGMRFMYRNHLDFEQTVPIT